MKQYYYTKVLLCACMMLVTHALFSSQAKALAQAINVTGTVTDAKGETMPGVNIVVKGTTRGVVSDLDGKFSIDVPDASTVLDFSFVGYTNQEIIVGNQTTIKIVMQEDTKLLDEVVVVGYGVSRKRDLTGTISQIKGKDIQNLPTASVTGAMVGKVSGVEFVSGSGSPGNSPVIRIRGTGTVNQSDPLIIIDGIVAGDMNQYNPNDVESIEILKDASSSAIYGTRAANGVIIITTKKGKAGDKVSVGLNAYAGISSPMKTLDLLQAADLVTLKKERYTNSGETPDAFWNDPYYSTQRTDWQDAFFSKGSIYNADLSIKGGNEKGTFYTSFGYYRDNGIIKPSYYERYSIRINSDYKITKRLKIGQNFQYSLMNNEDKHAELWDVLRYNPAIPVKYDDGSWGSVGDNRSYIGDLNNPVMRNNTDDNKNVNHRLQGNFTFDFEIIKGLFLKGNYGVNAKLGKEYTFLPVISGQPFDRPNAELRRGYNDRYRLVSETYLSYFKTFAQVHTINVTAGYSAEKEKGETFGAERRVFSDEAEDQRILDNGQTIQNASGNWYAESALASWYARAFYSYRDRYLLTITARADGSSKFPEGNRWAFLPAFSAGWRISEEAFMKDVSFVSNLKLTGGWGSLGNQSINDFQYLSTIKKGDGRWIMYNFGGTQVAGAALSQLGNQAITWEKTNMTNIGLEAGFLKHRLNTVITFFDKNTTDMLLRTVEVGTLGLIGIPPSNIGKVNNRGVEVELSWRDQVGQDFSYNAGFNATFIKNKVTELWGDGFEDSYLLGPGYGRSNLVISRTYVGDPMRSFYGWKTAGLYQTPGEINNDPYLKNDARRANIKPGDVRFVDTNNDGRVDEKDRVNIGNPNPKAVLGFNGGAAYKGFDLSFSFTSSLGLKIFNADRMQGLDATQVFNLYAESMGRWNGEGTSNEIPRMLTKDDDFNENYRVSDMFVENGNYVMLKNLMLGYNIPQVLTNKAGIGSVRVYVSGQNLFTITKYSGLTPELGYNGDAPAIQKGVDTAPYPLARIFTAGVSVEF